MKKTKIVNGRREWANKDYVEEIQTCYANPNLGKGYFVEVWVKELLVDELGFLFMSGGQFFILASNEGDPGVAITIRWENGHLVFPCSHSEQEPEPVINLMGLLDMIRSKWEAEYRRRKLKLEDSLLNEIP